MLSREMKISNAKKAVADFKHFSFYPGSPKPDPWSLVKWIEVLTEELKKESI